jgi:quercetin dioxygenase-like cupin family protein
MKRSGKSRRKLLLAGLGSLGVQLAPGGARAQDAAKAMPRSYRVALDNDKLRVLEFTGRPGMGICGESMHSHPEHLTIILSDFQGKVTTPDGKTHDKSLKLGDVFWAPPETHRLENTGRSNSRVLIVELKPPAPRKA